MNWESWRFITARSQFFLTEIFQLHKRLMVVFLLFIGLVLSGNEQLALRQTMAHLASFETQRHGDFVLLGLLLGFAAYSSLVLRFSLQGGGIRHFLRALPMPFYRERLMRCFLLSFGNISILLLIQLGLQQMIVDAKGSAEAWATVSWGLGNFAGLYLLVLGLQLSLLEARPLWIIGFIGMALLGAALKDNTIRLEMHGVTMLACICLLRLPEQYAEPRSGPLADSLRRWVSARCPQAHIAHIAYLGSKPGDLLTLLLISGLLQLCLFAILRQQIPESQAVYVYTVCTGLISFCCGKLYRTYRQMRSPAQVWLASLPRPGVWHLDADTRFVVGLFLVLDIPLALALILMHAVPLSLPLFVLGIHCAVLRMARGLHDPKIVEYDAAVLIGAFIWFIALGYAYCHIFGKLV